MGEHQACVLVKERYEGQMSDSDDSDYDYGEEEEAQNEEQPAQ